MEKFKVDYHLVEYCFTSKDVLGSHTMLLIVILCEEVSSKQVPVALIMINLTIQHIQLHFYCYFLHSWPFLGLIFQHFTRDAFPKWIIVLVILNNQTLFFYMG